MNKLTFLLAIALGGTFTLCVAQIGQKPTPASTSKKDTLVLTAKYGSYINNSKAFVSDMKKLLNLELKVTDNMQNDYAIFSCRLGWRRKEMSDDWRTGKKKTVMSFNAIEINNSGKIPASWQMEMAENLKAGEEIMFEEILAQNKKTNRVVKVAPIKIGLQ